MPSLILLPGMDGTGDLFASFLKALPPGFRGTTISYPADRALGYGDLESLVREVLPGTGAFTLVAESFSTPLALRIAAAPPPGLRAVVLCAGFACSPLPPSLRWLQSAAEPALFRGRPPAAILRMFLVGRDAPPALVRSVQSAIVRVRPGVLAHRLREILAVDVRHLLPAVDLPALSMLGSRDRLLGRRSASLLAAGLPALQSCLLAGGPHLLLQSRPEESAVVIARFVREKGG